MFKSASLFIGTSFAIAVFTIFATSNVSIVGIPHKIYSMTKILIHIKSWFLCEMCPSAPRLCSEPGGQKLVLSLSLDLILTCSYPIFPDANWSTWPINIIPLNFITKICKSYPKLQCSHDIITHCFIPCFLIPPARDQRFRAGYQ